MIYAGDNHSSFTSGWCLSSQTTSWDSGVKSGPGPLFVKMRADSTAGGGSTAALEGCLQVVALRWDHHHHRSCSPDRSHMYSYSFFLTPKQTQRAFYFNYSFCRNYDRRQYIIICISQLLLQKADDCLELHKLQNDSYVLHFSRRKFIPRFGSPC